MEGKLRFKKIDKASLIDGRKFTRGAYIWRGNLMEGFCITSLGTYIWRGLFSEFYGTVMLCSFVVETLITSVNCFQFLQVYH